MTKITRDVILDLLPLYLADEVSADTRMLVEHYLEDDPELAEIARQSPAAELPQDIPVVLNREHALQAYREAQRLRFLQTLIVTGVVSFAVMCIVLMGLAFVMLTT